MKIDSKLKLKFQIKKQLMMSVIHPVNRKVNHVRQCHLLAPDHSLRMLYLVED